ncbi:hypothetical protein [Streptomyces sp. NPDC048172]|uniref:hypothetical protein n=1 Tax=Streptomyces sp. NPDC048172 TaxID=3365505 RepID=UPI0037249987
MLRQRIRERVRALDLTPPLDIEEVCGAIARQRDRPIELRPYPLPVPGPFGLWVETPAGDLIVFQQHTSKAHQDHIVVHELSHLLSGHPGVSVEEMWRQMVPVLGIGSVTRVVQRCCSYDEAYEREAELTATLVAERTSTLNHVLPRSAGVDPTARRLHAVLGDYGRWM